MIEIYGTNGSDLLVGSAESEAIDGAGGNDTIFGNGGSDRIGGGAGNDSISSGDGNDTVYGSMIIVEADTLDGGAGTDFLDLEVASTAGVNFSVDANKSGTIKLFGVLLIRNFEQVRLVFGNGDDTLVGGNLADSIIGGRGNDFLDGSAGSDTIFGSFDNDTIYGGEGNDSLNGGEGADLINGAAGDDTISGGDGADSIIGGAGFDCITISANDDAFDVSGGDQIDYAVINLIGSSHGVNFSVSANLSDTIILASGAKISGIERVSISGSGTANDSIAGGDLSDTILGNGGRDTLDGGGAVDTLIGGRGNDTYVVTQGDVIYENPGEGIDSVYSADSWTLGQHTENLILTGIGSVSGKGNPSGNRVEGNEGSNTLYGLKGADIIIGFGGADVIAGGPGRDTLTGAEGGDVLVFNAALSTSNVDTVTDFTPLSDKLRLDNDVFTEFAPGVAITAAQLYAAAGANAAHELDDRIIYDTSTGKLYYDADGNLGGSSAVLFAVLSTMPTLSPGDFVIVA